jgi:hypothetical protein
MTKNISMNCLHCHHWVMADIIGSYGRFAEYDDDPVQFSMTRCPRCESPSLVSQDRGQIEDDGVPGWSSADIIYPQPFRNFGFDAPSNIHKLYTEAHRCFQSKVYTSCTLMCRKVLEATCIELGECEGTLHSKIENLKSKNIINGQLYDWVTALRMIGNQAAHNVQANFSKDEAKWSLDFTEALLDYIFVLSKKFKEFNETISQKEPQKEEAS